MENFFHSSVRNIANLQLFVYFILALSFIFLFIFLFSFHNIPCLRFLFVILRLQEILHGTPMCWCLQLLACKWQGFKIGRQEGDKYKRLLSTEKKKTLKYCYEDLYYGNRLSDLMSSECLFMCFVIEDFDKEEIYSTFNVSCSHLP